MVVICFDSRISVIKIQTWTPHLGRDLESKLAERILVDAVLGFVGSLSLRLQQDCLTKTLVDVIGLVWIVSLIYDIHLMQSHWKFSRFACRVSPDFQKMCAHILAQALVESVGLSLVATLIHEPRLGR